jgi:hypothetical protein
VIAALLTVTLFGALGALLAERCAPVLFERSPVRIVGGAVAAAIGAWSASVALLVRGAVLGRADASGEFELAGADLAVGVLLLMRPRDRAAPPPPHLGGLRWLCIGLAALVLVAALLDLGALLAMQARKPHGTFDAFGIWNARARFLARAGSDWGRAFLVDARSHPDYPLLQPLTVARFWACLGGEPRPCRVRWASCSAPACAQARPASSSISRSARSPCWLSSCRSSWRGRRPTISSPARASRSRSSASRTSRGTRSSPVAREQSSSR